MAVAHETHADTPNVVERLTRWLTAWQAERQARRELDGLPDDEVGRIAHDLGLSTSDLERLADRDPNAELLLYRRLALLDLSPAALEKAGFLRDLQRTCSLCDSQETCRHDLAERPTSGDWRKYCPNSQVLEAASAEGIAAVEQPGCCAPRK